MKKGRQFIQEGTPHPAQRISPPANPSTTSPPAPLRPEPLAAPPEPPGEPASGASILRQEQALAPVLGSALYVAPQPRWCPALTPARREAGGANSRVPSTSGSGAPWP